ncbi:hypothetical protein KIPB_000655 [Kipferlia bialata]|uniref:Uncharacterized protein n=1 Tax=Kipferlia bialata TaxID=797122 RepID=A0A9K3CPI4_9EUKA|nr:hypothetical protein KIPB_000655 [Kipferlia bialata]|eukprot:g655.t1
MAMLEESNREHLAYQAQKAREAQKSPKKPTVPEIEEIYRNGFSRRIPEPCVSELGDDPDTMPDPVPAGTWKSFSPEKRERILKHLRHASRRRPQLERSDDEWYAYEWMSEWHRKNVEWRERERERDLKEGYTGH